jgi:hypothetical protein
MFTVDRRRTRGQGRRRHAPYASIRLAWVMSPGDDRRGIKMPELLVAAGAGCPVEGQDEVRSWPTWTLRYRDGPPKAVLANSWNCPVAVIRWLISVVSADGSNGTNEP